MDRKQKPASRVIFDSRLQSRSEGSKPTAIELKLFYLLIFLIPTNLFLVLNTSSAFVGGILVDYLIPKLYLSDLVIVSILAAWATRIWPTIPNLARSLKPFTTIPKPRKPTPYYQKLIKSKFSLTLTLALLTASLILSTLASRNPTAGAWFLTKSFILGLLSLWIITNIKNLKTLIKPLTITTLFQSSIAIIQWIQKKSLLGYLLLGETTLKTTSQIAKTSLGGQLRPLPYGTTAHPNILAGFLSLSLFILLLTHSTKDIFKSRLLTTTIVTGLISLALTQSISAIAALAVALALIKLRPIFAKHRPIFIILAIITLVFTNKYLIPPESITRRIKLATASLEMVLHHPVLGVGPNNFITRSQEFVQIPGTTRFLQPAHNIYLLFVSETGLVTTAALISLFSLALIHRDKRKKLAPETTIPLLMILLIGTLDHYPLTLQTGQLLLALSAGLALTPLFKPRSST